MNAAEKLEHELGRLEETMIADRLDNARLRTALTELRNAAETAAIRLRSKKAWDELLGAIARANTVLASSPLAGDPTKEEAKT